MCSVGSPSLCSLASLLGYIEFSPSVLAHGTAGSNSDGTGSNGPSPTNSRSVVGVTKSPNSRRVASVPPIDVHLALVNAEQQGSLTVTLPWVLAFLRFASLDDAALHSPYYRKTLAWLLRLRRRLGWLRPGHAQFRHSALCILTQVTRPRV